jgi:hypothetical protein
MLASSAASMRNVARYRDHRKEKRAPAPTWKLSQSTATTMALERLAVITCNVLSTHVTSLDIDYHGRRDGTILRSGSEARMMLLRARHRFRSQDGIGWKDYLKAQPDWRPRQAPLVSAMVPEALEHKTHPGALIASLSTPFGEQVSTEVHDVDDRAVRPPDFYCAPWRCSALGEQNMPPVGFAYLNGD